MELSEWVRAARAHKNLTQEKLGEAVGVTKSNVSGWENGRHQPSYGQMLKIAEVTGMAMPDQAVAAEQSFTAQELPTSLAQSLSDSDFRIPQKPMSWGDLMTMELRGVFEVALGDEAMAPEFTAGTIVKFDTERAPAFGNRVLIRDARGAYHFRLYAQSPDAAWVGVATHSAFMPLSPATGAQIVAVKTGHYVEGA